ncbi:MAG: BlaI/MecI/CopY family transcriptional regulator [Candidatus Latescibacterota bacterium]|jgi:predicted transcriptional regulator
MAAKQTPELSPLELEVMNVIWELGECTSADVINQFTKKRKLANTTIRTVLANIRKKGYLDVVPSVEPRVRFKPRVSKRTVARRNVRQLLANMFGDSPREAIEFLLEEEDIDTAELDEIRRLIDEHAHGGEGK